jgi:hypothetical protein
MPPIRSFFYCQSEIIFLNFWKSCFVFSLKLSILSFADCDSLCHLKTLKYFVCKWLHFIQPVKQPSWTSLRVDNVIMPVLGYLSTLFMITQILNWYTCTEFSTFTFDFLLDKLKYFSYYNWTSLFSFWYKHYA